MLGFIPMHIKNYLESGVYIALTILFLFVKPFLGFISLHLLGLALWSLRSRARPFISSNKHYLSPIDGKVVEINRSCIRDGGECIKICIQTDLTDSHIQYAPIPGDIVKNELLTNHSNLELAQINLKSPFEVIFESKLVTEILNQKNHIRCAVETIVKPVLPAILPVLETIEYSSSFIDQGNNIGIWHFTPFASVLTYVYLDLGSEVEVEIGNTVVGGQTVLAFKGPRVFELNNPGFITVETGN